MNSKQAVAGLVLTVVATGCAGIAPAAEAPAPTPPTEPEIIAQFDRWNDALATGDAEAVADLYAPDGVLLPTLSKVVRADHESIAAYFAEDFLPRKPRGEIVESHVEILDEDTATRSGTYNFTVTDATGATSIVPARFTYVYEKTDGEWMIAVHHSSLLPAQ